jgi:hypothetical protein
VDKWSRLPATALVAEWTALTAQAPKEVLDGLLPDVVVHLFDLRGVLSTGEPPDDHLVTAALEFWADVAKVPIPEQPTDRFELLRAITGRRSHDQAPLLRHETALYGWRQDPLLE